MILVKICLTLYIICIFIDFTLLKTVADDLLQYEKIEKCYLLKLTVCKAFVNGGHCSKFQPVKRAWSVIVALLLISIIKNQYYCCYF